MDTAAPELPVDTLGVLRKRRSAKWQTYPPDVLPLTVAEMDFALAAPVAPGPRRAGDGLRRPPGGLRLCNPHNPVGRVHTAGELAALVRLAQAHGVTIVSDEIHGPLVLPGATFTPLLTVPGAAEVAVSVLSASKAWNLAGLKCATVVTGAPRMAALAGRFPADTRWRIGHLGVI